MIQSFKKLTIGLAALLLLTVGYSAKAVTLADLIGGAPTTITTGILTFSNFQNTTSGSPAFSPSDISVAALPTSDGLFFTYTGSPLTGTSPYVLDFTFLTTATKPLNYGILNFAMNGIAAGKSTNYGILGNLAENLSTSPPLELQANVFGTSNNLNSIISGSGKNSNPFTPSQSFTVTKQLTLSPQTIVGGTTYVGQINGFSFSQQFQDVPEPGVLTMLFGSGICGSLFFLKKRIA